MKTLIIRADATVRIGTGHVMRCIALAQAWQARGGSVAFLSYCQSDALRQRILDEGFHFIPVEIPHPHPGDLEQSLKRLKHASQFQCEAIPWLVLDGYHFSPDYQKAVQDAGNRLLVIDDCNHLPCYHADILLNQNIDVGSLQYACDPEVLLLLGPAYALVRREFLERKGAMWRTSEVARCILIIMGGADPDNVTLKVVRGLSALDARDIEARIVVGPANTHRAEIEEVVRNVSFRTEILGACKDMAKHMAWADVAVTAGGSTCMELALMGVPFLIIVLAENQKPGAAGLAKKKIAVNLGWHAVLTTDHVAHALGIVLEDKVKRESFSVRGRALVDGVGAGRVLETMDPTELKLHKAESGDCEIVWNWANDPIARAVSFSSDYIPLETHRRWFVRRLESPDCAFYIATNQSGVPVGQARFEIMGMEAVISVSLGPEFRGLRLGSELIRKASEKCLNEKNVEKIYALIKRENAASIQAFQKAGYRNIGDEIHKGCHAMRMYYGKDGQK